MSTIESLIEQGEALAREAQNTLSEIDSEISALQARRKQVAKLARNFGGLSDEKPRRQPKLPVKRKLPVQRHATLVTLSHALLEHSGEKPFTVRQAAEWSGIHATTVRKSLPELQEIGFVRLDRGSGGKGQPALFAVLDRQAIDHLNGGAQNGA